MKKSWFGVAFLLVLSCLLTSCAHYPHPDDLFSRFAEKYPLPPGKVFRTSAQAGAEEYLSQELFRKIYARSDGSDDFEDIDSAVVWQGVSAYAVYEMGIFLCKDGDSARSVVLMCQNRLRLLNSFKSYANTEAVDTAVLRLSGRMVIFLVLPDNTTAEKVIDRIL